MVVRIDGRPRDTVPGGTLCFKCCTEQRCDHTEANCAMAMAEQRLRLSRPQ